MPRIKKVHRGEYRPVADLITYSPMPTASLQHLDPFLFLNHHGPQHYQPHNNGLPFGPHPHRGIETVTFILEGDIVHQDSNGFKSTIEAGGIQWMTAGSGLLHSEVSSEQFKKEGGDLEILQLWLNLPARLKMTKPHYQGLQDEAIPRIKLSEGEAELQLISGDFNGKEGPFPTQTDVFLGTIRAKKGAAIALPVPKGETIFFYIVRGKVEIDGEEIQKLHLVEFDNEDEEPLAFGVEEDATILVGHAKPFREPIVAQGPFVMNSMEEIYQAFDDYQNGRMGVWEN